MARNDTAERIIEFATQQFRDRGYHATSMNDIAKGVGLKKASLYNHFPGKGKIAQVVVENVNSYFQEHIFAVAYQDHLSGSQRLRAVLDNLAVHYTDKNACILASLSMGTKDEPELPWEEIRQLKTHWTDAFSHILQTKFPHSEAQHTANDIVVRIQGSLILRRLDDNADQDILRRCLEDIAGLLN
jgi:TetR/AcrR family transcriptional repressor of nem operon